MRVTIVVPDNTILVDGKSHSIDCSSLSPDTHAVQWDGTTGEIEYASIGGHKLPNEQIEDVSRFQSLIDAWTVVENASPK